MGELVTHQMYSPRASHPISHHGAHPRTVLNAHDAPDRRVESGSTEIPLASHTLHLSGASESGLTQFSDHGPRAQAMKGQNRPCGS